MLLFPTTLSQVSVSSKLLHVSVCCLLFGFPQIQIIVFSLFLISHAAPLHLVAEILSIFNTELTRSHKLIKPALIKVCISFLLLSCSVTESIFSVLALVTFICHTYARWDQALFCILHSPLALLPNFYEQLYSFRYGNTS